ncbi:filamentous hemagglutinin family protein [Pseudomonas protegens]|uniref:two-partner secretion domain-containing protein n=1 Tax=Pseudomonas TaxID=286 RepID=UPI000F4AD0D1|nr:MULTISPECIES: GLUG motif-containing protein [Pseudomonas]MCS4261463.1 filamentous hemagglutinin family protein [Pseudomonas sp. BIGb0176]ROQ60974.1 filamentous hemagglutinin family protein [Pseudomonas protegens]ROQ83292.1 filamentous hemagglutinin family protein [Pseudomonas protegens]
MNKNYALVWNHALGCWNVADEGARRRSKAGRSKAVIGAGLSLLGLLLQAPAFALPSGGNIVSGNADIQTSSDGQHLTINQQSNKLITNWNDFNVKADERVSFQQPGSNAIALNRVLGTQGSDIQGRIDANGKVFLINPNGVVFGQSAQVDVGSLVASTQDITDKDFLNGNYRFSGTSSASISNAGTLTASDGGSIALLGAQVSNSGLIQARVGSVALGAGNDITLDFNGNGLLGLQVKSGAVDALAQNGGLLKADGGQVLMTAKSADSLLRTVVSNQGVIEAKTLQNKAGRIVLDGDNGIVQVAGRQDASAIGGQGDGGVVENQGARVDVQLAAQVNTHAEQGKTGTWRIHANDISIASTENPGRLTPRGLVITGGISGTNSGTTNGVGIGVGANATGSGNGGNGVGVSIGGNGHNNVAVIAGGGPANTRSTLRTDTLASNLDTTHIELNSTQGNLTVSAPLTWTSGNSLSLTAERGDIRVEGALRASGNKAGLVLNAQNGGIRLNDNIALSGTGASLGLNHGNNGYTLEDGKAVTLSGAGALFKANGQDYAVIHNLDQLRQIDSNSSGHYVLGNKISGNGARFKSLGERSGFGGVLDGLGNSIENLSVYGTSGSVGLFSVNQGEIRNLNLDRVSVSGDRSTHYNTLVGTLAGVNMGLISNVKASQVQVTGASHANSLGGLVALNLQDGSIDKSSASGTLVGNRYTYVMGGLAAENINNGLGRGIASISNSRADVTLTGQMAGQSSAYGAGGLVGANRKANISNSSSTGLISLAGDNLNLGGLVGFNTGSSTSRLSTVDSTVNVRGNGRNTFLGGLIGFNTEGAVNNASASGSVNGNNAQAVGGLVGKSLASRYSNVSAAGNVTGGARANVGGLIGELSAGSVNNASASGTLNASHSQAIGGLIGKSEGASLSNVSASASVLDRFSQYLGGLLGHSRNTTVNVADATGNVTGGANAFAGGLIGYLEGGTLANASAKGDVQAGDSSFVGGLVGFNDGRISNASASGKVMGTAAQVLGGLVGGNSGSIEHSSASAKVTPVNPGYIHGGLIGLNLGQQSFNHLEGEAAKLPLIGRSLPF